MGDVGFARRGILLQPRLSPSLVAVFPLLSLPPNLLYHIPPPPSVPPRLPYPPSLLSFSLPALPRPVSRSSATRSTPCSRSCPRTISTTQTSPSASRASSRSAAGGGRGGGDSQEEEEVCTGGRRSRAREEREWRTGGRENGWMAGGRENGWQVLDADDSKGISFSELCQEMRKLVLLTALNNCICNRIV
jgi:hypothetical protein